MTTLKTRADIAEALGITTKQLSELYHKQQIKLPPCVYRKRSTLYYHADQADAFVKSEPLKAENRLIGGINQTPAPMLDNTMAVAFISQRRIAAKPATMTEWVKNHLKNCGMRDKTITVHLQERNDYVPPHSALTRSSNNCDHRLSVSF